MLLQSIGYRLDEATCHLKKPDGKACSRLELDAQARRGQHASLPGTEGRDWNEFTRAEKRAQRQLWDNGLERRNSTIRRGDELVKRMEEHDHDNLLDLAVLGWYNISAAKALVRLMLRKHGIGLTKDYDLILPA